jgi:hypothetical protein
MTGDADGAVRVETHGEPVDPGGSVLITTLGLAVFGLLIFGLSSVVQYRCGWSGCVTGLRGRLDVEAVGGLPRLFTTAVFVLVASLAVTVARRSRRSRRTWWAGLAVGGGLLAVAKLVSAHSDVESSGGRAVTLVLSVGLSAAGISLLAVGARRWQVPGARPVIVALIVYSFAALGLDAVTVLVESAQAYVGLRSRTALAFMEEFGEALAALGLLATVRCARLRELADVQS